MKKLILALAMILPMAHQAEAAITSFDLMGIAGAGLLPGNEPGSITGGTGGEIGAGISYDDVAKLLTINVGWGSSQGFTDLSSTVTASHIHGPTAAVNGLGFTQTTGVFVNLTRSSSAATGGVFTSAPISFNATQEAQLFDGKFYINIHTANNGGGEMRAFLVPVPEPETYAMLLAGLALVGAVARKRNIAA